MGELKAILKLKNDFNLSTELSIFLVSLYQSEKYNLNHAELTELKQRNKEDADFKFNLTKTLDTYLNKDSSLKQEIKKILKKEEKVEIVEKSSEYEENLELFHSTFVEYIPPREINIIKEYLGSDTFLKEYLSFIYMFPNPVGNEKWNKHFNVIYDNVVLRRKTNESIKKLNKLFLNNKYNNLKLLVAVYLFIESGISRNRKKAYIRKMSLFFDELDMWYNEATLYLETKSTKELLGQERWISNNLDSFQL